MSASHSVPVWLLPLVALGLTACSPPAPLPNDAYIWQRKWTPALTDALRDQQQLVQRWRVLAAELETGPTTGQWRVMQPDWQSLRASQPRVVAVFRLNGQTARWDEAQALALIRSTLDQWQARGLRLAGVEVDYDCGTARLDNYRAFLGRLRAQLPPALPLSITALPAWLDNPAALTALLAVPDEAVLQVHAVRNPAQGLFDGPIALDWAERFAERTGRPWRIALPTYGTRVVWDRAGRLAGAESETPLLASAGGASRELLVTPAEMADFVQQLEKRRPAGLAGLVWFRLPTRDDRRAWSLTSWRAVLSRQPLRSTIELTQRQPAPGLYELWLTNQGNADALLPSAIRWPSRCMAADGSGGYALDYGKDGPFLHLKQPALLRAGERRQAGWLRCEQLDAAKDIHVQD